jgi:hypothetical protein
MVREGERETREEREVAGRRRDAGAQCARQEAL